MLHTPEGTPPRTSSIDGDYNMDLCASKPRFQPFSEATWLRSPFQQTTTNMMHTPADRAPLTPISANTVESPSWQTTDPSFQGISDWSDQKDKIVRAPYDYLESLPGKDIRTQLIMGFNQWLEVPAESLQVISRVVAMLHTASLLIDDIEDSSQLRRGSPVAHNIFGTAQTINSANYMYFVALQELQKLQNPQAVLIFTEELLNLHRGQGMDLYWRDTLTCPTEEDYLEMVGNKTGGLFRLAVKLMQAESSTKK